VSSLFNIRHFEAIVKIPWAEMWGQYVPLSGLKSSILQPQILEIENKGGGE
jgi:hypothetical protein